MSRQVELVVSGDIFGSEGGGLGNHTQLFVQMKQKNNSYYLIKLLDYLVS